MPKLHFSILINAPREKVWEIMLGDKTYQEWTAAFMPDSHLVGRVEGSWEKGSKIKFLSTDKEGKTGGMVSEIAENKPNEFLSIHHLGIVTEGVEDTTSEAAKEWDGFENYTFKELDGQTELTVDMDSKEDYQDYFSKAWPQALEKLKELAEKE